LKSSLHGLPLVRTNSGASFAELLRYLEAPLRRTVQLCYEADDDAEKLVDFKTPDGALDHHCSTFAPFPPIKDVVKGNHHKGPLRAMQICITAANDKMVEGGFGDLQKGASAVTAKRVPCTCESNPHWTTFPGAVHSSAK